MGQFERIVTMLYWFLAIPFAVGTLPVYLVRKGRKNIVVIYLSGLCIMASVFQVLGTVFVFGYKTFTQLVSVYTIVIELIALAGLILFIIGTIKKSEDEYFELPTYKNVPKIEWFTTLFFLALLFAQILLAWFVETPNGDDGYYVAIGNIANMTDKMFTVNAYTGWSEELNFRHALSQFPLFYGFIARKLDIHVAVVAHKFLPPFLIVVTYMIYNRIALYLFNFERSKKNIFMVLIAALQLFGASSIYSNEVFFLTRTWQGKSMLANIAIPGVFLILLALCKEKVLTNKEMKGKALGERISPRFIGLFIMLCFTNIFTGFTSCLGMLLVLIYEGLVLLLITIRKKNSWYITLGFASMIPCFVYIFLYMFR